MDAETRRLADQAERKIAAGEKLTREESRARKAAVQAGEAELLERGRREIPKAWWVEHAGTSAKVLLEQSDRWQLNLRGKTIDLADFLPRLYRLLNRNAKVLDRETNGDGPPSPKDRLAAKRADLLDLEYSEKSGRLRDVAEIHDLWERISGHIRRASELMQRASTAKEAYEILVESLDEADNELAALHDRDTD